MGCGCRGKGSSASRNEVLGYQVVLPDGVKVPPDGDPPFLSVAEAKVEVRQAGGGTIHRLTRNRAA